MIQEGGGTYMNLFHGGFSLKQQLSLKRSVLKNFIWFPFDYFVHDDILTTYRLKSSKGKSIHFLVLQR